MYKKNHIFKSIFCRFCTSLRLYQALYNREMGGGIHVSVVRVEGLSDDDRITPDVHVYEDVVQHHDVEIARYLQRSSEPRVQMQTYMKMWSRIISSKSPATCREDWSLGFRFRASTLLKRLRSAISFRNTYNS